MNRQQTYFKRGVFKCTYCGRKTKGTPGHHDGGDMCPECNEYLEHENLHIDHEGIKGWKCGDGENCILKQGDRYEKYGKVGDSQ